jgi:putative SOS response-associated peptidase YedK
VIVDEFGVTSVVNVDLEPRYNIAPTQSVESIVRNGNELRLGPMSWGFRLSAAAKGPSPINARSETVATSPLFREAFQRRRCLVVADGFYEWRAGGARKRPYFIRLRSGRPFGLAGIWAGHRSEAGAKVATCAILTCRPNDLVAEIHNRMPVIVPPENREQWLNQRTSLVEIAGLLTPLPAQEMEAYEVSPLVNSARHDGPECMRPVDVNRHAG